MVLGVPRGAMPMAKIIADHLEAPLSAVLAHKIGAPSSPEYAIGCVGLLAAFIAWPRPAKLMRPHIKDEANKQFQILQERKKSYGLEDIDLENKSVIIVDDGIATGATTICAIDEVRSQMPKKIALACAVAPPSTAEKLENSVDEAIILSRPSDFYAVGQFFKDFGRSPTTRS